MKRRHLLSGLGAAPFASFSWRSAWAADTWDFYSYTGISHPISVQLKQFAEEVRKRSNGELSIAVRPAGELPFNAYEIVRTTGEGQVQLGESVGVFTSGTVPLTGVTGLPMLLRNPADMEKAMPIVRKHVNKEFEKAGVKVLFQFLWPVQNIYGTGKPIRTLGDLQGRKLRTISAQQAEMLRRLGAASVSLAGAEVPVAIERKMVEGVVTSAFNLVNAKWAEFLKWAYIADLHVADDYILVNIAAYNKLSPKTRQVLDEVANEWAPKITQMNLAAEAGSLETLRTQYKFEIIRASKEDIGRLTDKMKNYWTEWAQQLGPEAVAMLGEIRAAIGK